jgi:hypothetical protein
MFNKEFLINFSTMGKWTKEQEQYLIENYPTKSIKVLMQELGKSRSSVYSHAFELGLKKDEQYLIELRKSEAERLIKIGEKTRWGKRPGWNKGTKGVMKPNKTSFQKGLIPHNVKEVGSWRRDKDNNKVFKTESGEWKTEKLILWESVNGPVPEGLLLHIIDGNPDNIVIENLRLATKEEIMHQNSIFTKYPRDLIKAIKLLSKLKRKINAKQN